MKVINADSLIFSKEIFDSFKTINPLSFFENFQAFPIMSDRFGGLNKYSTFNLYATKSLEYLKNIKNYPYGNSIQQFLFDAVDRRGKYLLDKAYKDFKHIYLLWSGGIDSTAAFVSFLKNISEEQKKMFHVVMSKRAIDEYKLFFEKYISGKFDIVLTNKENYVDVYKMALSNGYTITGDCGDQLYGSHIMHTLPFWFMDYRDYLKTEIYPNENIDNLIGQFEETFNSYGLNIKRVHDFVWWMNFSCKWDVVANSLKHLTQTNGENEIAFFDYKNFEIYAVNIPHDIHVTEYRDYKKDMKKYIYDFTGDEEYYKTKMKVGSSKSNHSATKNAIFTILTENKKLISYDINSVKTSDFYQAQQIFSEIFANFVK